MSSGKNEDSRWSAFATDPKFRPVPRKERKVAIDDRFRSMFSDKKFVDRVRVDKRGRPVKHRSTKEDFKRYYRMQDEENSDSSDSSDSSYEESNSVSDKRFLTRPEVFTASSNDSSEIEYQQEDENRQFQVEEPDAKGSPDENNDNGKKLDTKLKGKLKDLSVNYARGEGDLGNSSSSEEDSDSSDSDDEEEDEQEVETEEQFDKWGELDHDAETTEEATSRLAVCNMDWDRVEAQDIFVALNSFCPVGGSVKNVRVFVSDYGKRRLEEEDRLGPEELRARDEEEAGEEMEEELGAAQDQEEVDRRAMERVRRYQVNRLKYHYAVAEFDSADSASRVYTECDGREYELSATRFDLRFVPEDMEFEDDPKSECSRMPEASSYKPKSFTTSALQLGKVELTWDETDPERAEAMRRMFEANSDDDDDEQDDSDVKRLIGGGDDDDENNEDMGEGDGEENDDQGDSNAIEKYKKLLGDLKEKDKKKKSKWAEMEGDSDDDNEEEGNMEMVFEDDKKSNQVTKEELDSMTPWEKYLHKKKEKKKAKKLQKSAEEGFEDPFFAESGGVDETLQSKTQQKKLKKEKKLKKKIEEENAEKGDLALFTMDSDDEKEHFDFKEIVKKESKKGKKKKQKGDQKEPEESFNLDLGDDRFAAVFENPEYNVDPSHPNFKKTKAMQDIIAEKQRRILGKDSDKKKRKRQLENKCEKVSKVAKKTNDDNLDLDKLVKSVKSKAKKKKQR